MAFIILYITHKNIREAKKIVNHLLEKKLIACANFFPIESSYWWNGKIENNKEIVSLIKTKKENWKKVESAVKKIHPYKTPCIMKLTVEANSDYELWISKETR
ncbi:MAG: divalent-cation tolerance protein CutA [Candidatus Woesearchaeota archaeon]